MPMMDKKSKGAYKSDASNTVVKGKKSYSGRYGDGLAKESKIVIKEKGNFSSRYK